MLISHSHKFVFVHIPKTAGTSVRHVLQPYCESPTGNKRWRRLLRKLGVRQDPAKAHFRGHDTARQVRAAFGPAYDTYLTFSVVRNPFDHAVSHYSFLKEAPNAKYREYFGGMSFDDYLSFRNRLTALTPLPPFATIKDQTSFVADGAGRIIVSRILKFEELATAFPALLAELGIEDQSLPRKRATKARGASLSDYYGSEDTVRRVRELYSRDFENFGYSVDLPG